MTAHPAVEWLQAKLTQVEEAARAAGGDAWAVADDSDTVALYDSSREPVVYDEGWPSAAQQQHIALHDPTAVLRRIAADRKQLALHSFPHSCPPGPLNIYCDTTPCRTMLLLAESWGWTAP